MITDDAEAVLFSVKNFTAAMLAYYIALRIGFAQPVWAVTTVYVVAQPLAGAVLSKAFFRLLGTLLGSAAAVVFLPAFVNEPLVLSLALALWLGLCVYIAQLDRTPRSYTFLLAGYTACIIGFPSVATPGNIFNTAILRFQEIGISIVTVSLVHGAIWPRTVTKRLQTQITAIVGSSEQCSRRSLAGSRDAVLDRERRQLASNINGIDALSVHLAFDTARLIPRATMVRALQDQLSWLLPLTGVVEDRIAECRTQGGGLRTELVDLIRRVDEWLGRSVFGTEHDEVARELVAEAERLEHTIGVQAPWGWREILLVSLLARLAELVLAHRLLRELHDQINSGKARGLSPEAARLIRSATGRSFHRDPGLALRSALGSSIAVAGVCAFWIATAWPSGATAALIVGIGCALLGALPQPGVRIRRFFLGSLAGIGAAAALGFVVLPRVTDFVMLAATLAPFLLLFSSFLARAALAAFALGGLLGFTNTVGLSATYQSDFNSFLNGAIAQLAATGVAVIVIDMFNVVGAEVALARLLRAEFRDISARADGRARDTSRWASRMIDRISLIAARSGQMGLPPALPTYDGLVGLRIGYLAGELRVLFSTLATDKARNTISAALAGISQHFGSVSPANFVSPAESLLYSIDRAMAEFVADPQPDRRRSGAILLAGLRRSLFPHAEAFARARQ
jgi:uncharacterized membrane protein YccC